MPHIKIELVRVLSVMYKTFHKNSTVNMYYVHIKIKKKNTIGLAKRIVIFLHCSFPFVWEGGVVVHQLRAENLGLWLT